MYDMYMSSCKKDSRIASDCSGSTEANIPQCSKPRSVGIGNRQGMNSVQLSTKSPQGQNDDYMSARCRRNALEGKPARLAQRPPSTILAKCIRGGRQINLVPESTSQSSDADDNWCNRRFLMLRNPN